MALNVQSNFWIFALAIIFALMWNDSHYACVTLENSSLSTLIKIISIINICTLLQQKTWFSLFFTIFDVVHCSKMSKITTDDIKWIVKEQIFWKWILTLTPRLLKIFSYKQGVDCGRDERRLLDDLLKFYNSLERPVFNESEAVDLQLGLTLQQIIDVVSSF